MRPLLALLLALHPAASAQQVKSPVPATGAPAAPAGIAPVRVPTVPVATLPTLPSAALLAPSALGTSLPGSAPAPAAKAAHPVVPEATALEPAAPIRQRMVDVGEIIARDAAGLPRLGSEGSSAVAERHLHLLLGHRASLTGGFVEAPAYAAPAAGLGSLSPSVPAADEKTPAPEPPQEPDDERRRSVRWMIGGTSAAKLGIEVVTLGVPLFALQSLGGAIHVATLAIVYGLSQVAFSSLAGSLTDRFPASRVLAGANLAQAGLVGGLLVLAAAGLFSPWMLFPVYALVGGAAGIAETARRVVPPLLLGQNEEALKSYNARLHIFYEIAGVGGALLAGLLIATVGPLYALLLQPPAFLLSVLAFRQVRHPFRRKEGPGEGWKAKLSHYAEDLRLGMRTVLGDARFRWVAVAMVFPSVVHRVFESLLLPVYTAKVLGDGSLSAILLTSSNLGELLGAVLLLRLASKFRGAYAWVAWSAAGLLAAWALSASTALAMLVPAIVVFSLTWAASDLSLLSYLQSKLPEKAQARALSFLYGLTIVTITVTSLLMGRLLDAAPLSWAFIGINGAFTVLALLVWLAARRLRG